MSKDKNFFYRIEPMAVLSEMILIPESKRGQWTVQFFVDLKNGDPENTKSDIAANIIREAREYRARRAIAGQQGGIAKASKGVAKTSNATISDSKDVAISSNRSSNNNIKEESLKAKEKSPPRSASLIELPDFVSADAWIGFIEMRKKIKKPPTERAAAMLIKKLTMFHNTGHDVNDILDQSTLNSWQDLYEIKTNQGYVNGNGRASGSTAQAGRKTGIVEANGAGTDFLS